MSPANVVQERNQRTVVELQQNISINNFKAMTEHLIISEDQNTVQEFATNYEFVEAEKFNCCNAVCDFSSRSVGFCALLQICYPDGRVDGKNGYFKRREA